DGLGVGRVEAEVEFGFAVLFHGQAGDELVEGPGDFAGDESAVGVAKLALHAGGQEGGLAGAAGLRFFGGLLHGAAEGLLAGGEIVDVGDAVGGVVEGVAFGGDPSHFRR